MAEPWYLVADVGGTNARFAVFQGDGMVASVSYETAQCDDLLAAAQAFSDTLKDRPSIAVVAAAGPVRDNAVTLTNAQHALSGDALRTATGVKQAYIINDLAAAAWSTLDAAPDDLKVIAGVPRLMPGARVVIGPGTGLGVGALVFDGETYQTVTGEGGHIGTGPRTSYETRVFESLRNLWPGVFFGDTLVLEAEGIISGTGLPLLYQAVQIVEGLAPTAVNAAEIFDRANAGGDVSATKTISIFKAHLARLTGDFGLAFGAQSGVVFVGGITQKNPWLFDAEFCATVCEGGRFSTARKELNLYLFDRADAVLLGAHHFAKRMAERTSRNGKVEISREMNEAGMAADQAMEIQ